jgi:hypothetical protein
MITMLAIVGGWFLVSVAFGVLWSAVAAHARRRAIRRRLRAIRDEVALMEDVLTVREGAPR